MFWCKSKTYSGESLFNSRNNLNRPKRPLCLLSKSAVKTSILLYPSKKGLNFSRVTMVIFRSGFCFIAFKTTGSIRATSPIAENLKIITFFIFLSKIRGSNWGRCTFSSVCKASCTFGQHPNLRLAHHSIFQGLFPEFPIS